MTFQQLLSGDILLFSIKAPSEAPGSTKLKLKLEQRAPDRPDSQQKE